MKRKAVLAPIRYFELDERVNFKNHLEVSIKVEYDVSFMDVLCEEFKDSPISIYRWFENVTTITNYKEQLHYVSNLWIERKFYDQVVLHLSKYNLVQHTGTICLLLLCIKRIEKARMSYKEIDDQSQMQAEFGRFLNFLLKYRDEDKLVHGIELLKGSTVASFKYGDFILNNLLKIIDERFNDDLEGWILLHNKFRHSETLHETNLKIRDFDSYFKRYVFNKLEFIFKRKIPSINKRSLLYNQILAEAEISDYVVFDLKAGQARYKAERTHIIDKIRKDIGYKIRKKPKS